LQRGFLGVGDEFHDGRFPFAALDLDKGQTLRAVKLRNFSSSASDGNSGKPFALTLLPRRPRQARREKPKTARRNRR
jgi:hypothetical protein